MNIDNSRAFQAVSFHQKITNDQLNTSYFLSQGYTSLSISCLALSLQSIISKAIGITFKNSKVGNLHGLVFCSPASHKKQSVATLFWLHLWSVRIHKHTSSSYRIHLPYLQWGESAPAKHDVQLP